MAGRNSKYDAEVMPTLARQWRREGATLQQIANNLGVTFQTLNEWRKSKPELSDALRESTDYVNATVENALLKRARGFTYTEVTQEFERIDGRMVKVKSKRVKKLVLGDVDAQKFWTTNRMRGRWKTAPDEHVPTEDATANLDEALTTATQQAWEPDEEGTTGDI